MSQTAVEHVRKLREEMLRIRAEKPGSGYALDAFVRYMHEAAKAGLSPTRLRTESRDEVERFFAYTVPGPDGHVYWTGGKHGFKRNDGKLRTPARWWWEHVHGEIGTTTMRVNPTCGDFACINPEHSECKHFSARRYSDEQIHGMLQVAAMRLGHPPSPRDFDELGFPITSRGVEFLFRGWRKALRSAGLETRTGGIPVTARECVAALRMGRDLLGRWPSTSDYRDNAELRGALKAAGLPSSIYPLYHHLGSNWGEIIARAEAA